jgi:DNA-directed RNA polymerase subunit RPC12/RpoP
MCYISWMACMINMFYFREILWWSCIIDYIEKVRSSVTSAALLLFPRCVTCGKFNPMVGRDKSSSTSAALLLFYRCMTCGKLKSNGWELKLLQ